MAENQFAVFYLNDGKVVAADAVNSPKEFMICKQLVGKAVDVEALACLEDSIFGHHTKSSYHCFLFH